MYLLFVSQRFLRYVTTSQLQDIIRLLKEELLPSAVPAFGNASVVDSHVMRFPAAVSWFSPGSFESRPTLETPLQNLVCAGGDSEWLPLVNVVFDPLCFQHIPTKQENTSN